MGVKRARREVAADGTERASTGAVKWRREEEQAAAGTTTVTLDVVRGWDKEIRDNGLESAKRLEDLLESVESAETSAKVRMSAMHCMRRSLACLESSFLEPGKTYEGEEESVGSWLGSIRDQYLQCLINLAVSAKEKHAARTALAVAAACASRWRQTKIVFRALLTRCLLAKDDDTGAATARSMIGLSLLERFDDMRLAILEVAASLCTEIRERDGDEDKDDGAEDQPRLARRVLELLSHARTPASSAEPVLLLEDENKFARPPETVVAEGDTVGRRTEPSSNLDSRQKKKSLYHLQRRALRECWLAVLKLENLPEDVVETILTELPAVIESKVSQPLRFADFLLDTFNRPTGASSSTHLLALDALWILIQKDGLDYPLFYHKLYALLKPDIFLMRNRQKWMSLLPKFLFSSYLPAYLVAAFAKRLLRRGLLAPPQGAMWCLRVTLELIYRNPSVVGLVHKPADAERVLGPSLLDSRTDDDPKRESSHGAASSDDGEDEDGGGERDDNGTLREYEAELSDPFRDYAINPIKSHADRSSLWELEALRRHYCPRVSTLVDAFNRDVRNRKVATEMFLPGAIEDYAIVEYLDLFEAEVKRRAKECPLAYEAPEAETTASVKDHLRW